VLAQFGKHRRELNPGNRLHLGDHDHRALALGLGQPLQLADGGIDQVGMEAPTRAATSRPTASWAVETSRMPPSLVELDSCDPVFIGACASHRLRLL